MQFELYKAVWFFWILPILFVAFLFVERRRGGILARFVKRSETASKLPEYAPAGPWLQCACFLAALFFLGVALLKPYSGFEMREIARKGVDLFFLVDVSPSMLAEDVKPSRVDRARFELKDFLDELTGDRVGLIGFSGESFTLVPLTGDYKAFGLFLNELDPGLFPVAGTDIPGAIGKAVESFKKEATGSGKAIILITDGEDSVGLDASVIGDIKKYGVKVFIIGVGTPEGAPIPEEGGGYKTDAAGNVVVTKLNEAAMQDLAVATGGGYVRSVSGDLDLKQIYGNGIKRAFEEADYAKSSKKLPHYRFQWALLAGFGFLLLETLFSKRRGFLWRFAASVLRRRRTVAAFAISISLFSPSVRAVDPFALERADEAFADGRYEEALKAYSELKAANPDDPVLDYDLGDTYYKLGKYAEAEASFKKALNLSDPENRKKALYNLGNTAFRKQKLDEALSYYDKALQIDPDYDKARLNRDFVKKMQERQKEQDQQKQKQEQESQEQQDQNQQQQQQDQQKQEDQKNQERENQEQQEQSAQQNDQNRKNGNSEDQEQKNGQEQQQDEKQKEEKDSSGQDPQNEDEKKEGEKGDSEEREPDQEESQQQNQERDEDLQPGESREDGGKASPGKFDQNADQWLESVSDDPGKAMKYLIEKNSIEKTKRFDKDW